MCSYNEKSKISIYKWRTTNKEKYNAYMNGAAKQYYQQHKVVCNQKRALRNRYKTECVRLCNILLE